MALLPVVNRRSVQPQGGGQYLSVRVMPEAFGAASGRALSGVGSALQQFGQVAHQLSLRQDESQMMDVLAQARDEARVATYHQPGASGADDPGGWLTRQGSATLGLPEEVDAFYRDAEQRYMSQLQSPAAQRAFRRAWQNDRQQAMNQISAFQMNAMEAYRTNSSNSLVTAAVNQAYDGWNDPQIIAQSIQDARAAVVAQTLGQDPLVTQQAELDALSKIHTAVLSQMILEDPVAAEAYYNSNVGQMTAADQVNIQRVLRPAIDGVNTQTYTAWAVGAGSPAATALPALPVTEAGASAVSARVGTPYAATIPQNTVSFLEGRRVGTGVDIQNLNPTFAVRAERFIAAAELATRTQVRIWSGYRSPEEQAQIYAQHIGRDYTYNGVTYRYDPNQPRVALAAQPPQPGTQGSRHQRGQALDVGAGPALNWMRANASRYGIEFLDDPRDPGHMQLDVDAQVAGESPESRAAAQVGIPVSPHVAAAAAGTPIPPRSYETIALRSDPTPVEQQASGASFQLNLEAYGGDVEAAVVATVAGQDVAAQWLANGRAGVLQPEQAAQVAGAMAVLQENPNVPMTVQYLPTPGGQTVPAYFTEYRAGDYAAMYERAYSAPPRIREAVIANIDAEVARRERMINLGQEEARTAAWQAVAGGTAVSDLPPQLVAQLSPDYMSSLMAYERNNAGDVTVRTDPRKFYEIARMTPEELADADLTEYLPFLSEADFQQVVGWQRAAVETVEEGTIAPDYGRFLTENQIFEAGMAASPRAVPEDEQPRIWAAWGRANRAWEAANGQAPNDDVLLKNLEQILQIDTSRGGPTPSAWQIANAPINPATGLRAQLTDYEPVQDLAGLTAAPDIVTTDIATGDLVVTPVLAHLTRVGAGITGSTPSIPQLTDVYNTAAQAMLVDNPRDVRQLYGDNEASRLFDRVMRLTTADARPPTQQDLEILWPRFLASIMGNDVTYETQVLHNINGYEARAKDAVIPQEPSRSAAAPLIPQPGVPTVPLTRQQQEVIQAVQEPGRAMAPAAYAGIDALRRLAGVEPPAPAPAAEEPAVPPSQTQAAPAGTTPVATPEILQPENPMQRQGGGDIPPRTAPEDTPVWQQEITPEPGRVPDEVTRILGERTISEISLADVQEIMTFVNVGYNEAVEMLARYYGVTLQEIARRITP